MGTHIVIKSANELEVGMVVHRREREPFNKINVVRLTKNTIQFRDWYGSTFFVQKMGDGGIRHFAVIETVEG